MSRTSHPVEKGTPLAGKRWHRRNITRKPSNPAPRDVRRTEPRVRPAVVHTLAQCERALERAMPNHAQAADGTRWTCPCGREFVHVCDESEGCEWVLAAKSGGRDRR